MRKSEEGIHAQFFDTVLALESLASLNLLMAMFEVFCESNALGRRLAFIPQYRVDLSIDF